MTDKMDLSHINLFIAVPCMDGKVESKFKDSLVNTMKLLELFGATFHYMEVAYCADVYIARAKLLSLFYRHHEKPTHLMYIDSDMGWDPDDVIRMLLHDRDFLAAAGPKKQYPLKFAFALHDDYSRPLPMVHEVETRIAEVSEIGGAFVLLKRRCVERMVQAYPELEFESDYGVKEYALFDPIIIDMGPEWPKRRLSEDYAFCWRWRKIGGKVNVLLDVRLSHTGSHTFSGSLYDHLVQEDPAFDKPPDGMILKNNESFT